MTILNVAKGKFMKKLKFRWLAVFLLAVAGVFLVGCTNKKPESTEIPTGKSETEIFPILYINSGEYSYNYMQGYDIKMDAKSMYGALIPAKNEENLSFITQGSSEGLIRVEYNLYDRQGKLIENGTVSDENISETGAFDICLNNLTSEEAWLELKLCFNETDDAYYYARVVAGNDISNALKYVMDIENACLKKESPVDLTLSMEWDLVKNEASYYEADINSNYDQVTWGGLSIGDAASDYYINVVDSSEGITSFSVSYSIYTDDESKATYQITDFLRVREFDGEMFLLNFYRNTSEDFMKSEESFDTSTLYLGVGSGKEDFVTFEDGKQLFFVQNQTLYYFDIETNRISTVYTANNLPEENAAFNADKCDIRLLTKRGDYFYFMVGGYLSDAVHSGACGLSIMRYNLGTNEYEELFFQPARYNYELIIDELDMLSYMNDEGSIFFVSNGEIRSYNVESNSLKDEIKNVSLDSFVASPGGEYIGWSKKQDGGEDILAIKNLNTGNELNISPKEGTSISPIGFVKDDFVYGVSKLSENKKGVATDKQTLMYNICIVDKEGKLIKEYPQSDSVRVLGGTTSDTVIVLNLAECAEQGTIYNETSQQQIVSGNKSGQSAVAKKEVKLSDKGNVWAFSFETEFKGSPTFAIATLKTQEEFEKLVVEPTEISTYYKDRYFLYAKGSLYGTYKVMREALTDASNLAGVVTDIDNNKLYYRIAKSKTSEVLPMESGFAAELLTHEDGVVAAWSEAESDVNVLDITGFKPDDMLLFVSKGFPVLARYNADSFVWVIGYTDKTIKCQKSDSQEMFEISMEQAENIFAKTGYEYYTCNN